MKEKKVVKADTEEKIFNESGQEIKSWMKTKKFFLIKTDREYIDLVNEIITQNKYLYRSADSKDSTLYRHCAFDFETTGLDVRFYPEEGKPRTRIVGLCLAYNDESAYYIPVGHDNGENISWDIFKKYSQKLIDNVIIIGHNLKYDAQIAENWGLFLRKYPFREDTQILCWLKNSNNKVGLKIRAKEDLNRDMFEIKDLFPKKVGKKKVEILFNELTPEQAYIYGASDALNTFALFLLHEHVRFEQPYIHKLEIGIIDVVRKIESHRIKIDLEYIKHLARNITRRIFEVRKEIFTLCGCEFNLDSSKIVGEIFFDRLKLPHYADRDEALTTTGRWKTGADVIEDLANKYPQYKLFNLLVKYRKLVKSRGTYIENFLTGCDHRGEMKASFLANHVPSGRFASSSESKGSGAVLNLQSIPANYDLKFIKAKKILKNPARDRILDIELNAVYDFTPPKIIHDLDSEE